MSVEVPDPPGANATTDGDTDGTKPGDEMVVESEMLPWRLLRLVRVIMADPDVPREMGRDCGLTAMLKSGAAPTLSVIVVE
jgi:hypothetical protein